MDDLQASDDSCALGDAISHKEDFVRCAVSSKVSQLVALLQSILVRTRLQHGFGILSLVVPKDAGSAGKVWRDVNGMERNF